MRRAMLAVAVVAAGMGCSNAGETNLLSVSSTGVVRGFVYFDLNGNRALDPTSDDSVRNIRIRLLAKNSSDTISSALSDVHGFYRMGSVPVGTYVVYVDTVPLSDTAVVAAQDSSEVTVLPSDSVHINVGISYPHVTIAAARALVQGRKVFVEGIVLNGTGTYSDTTMHVQDTSAAIRMARLQATSAAPADSARFRGITGRRDGLPTLENVTTFLIAPLPALPTATAVTSAQASTAVGGTRDAQQLLVTNVTISDTLTVTGGLRLTVNETVNPSGPLEVLLDCAAPTNLQFCNPGQAPMTTYIPGNRFNIVGIAVPTGTPGLWRLKPRSQADLVRLLP